MNYSRTYYALSLLVMVLVAALAALEKRQAGQGQPFDGNPHPGVSLEVVSATWCGPCQRLKPILHDLQEEGYDIKIKMVDTYPRGIPELNYSRFDEFRKRETGFRTKGQIKETFRQIDESIFHGRSAK